MGPGMGETGGKKGFYKEEGWARDAYTSARDDSSHYISKADSPAEKGGKEKSGAAHLSSQATLRALKGDCSCGLEGGLGWAEVQRKLGGKKNIPPSHLSEVRPEETHLCL